MAFSCDRDSLDEKWKLIPGGGVVDVLMTHMPPRGVLDRVLEGKHWYVLVGVCASESHNVFVRV